MLNETPVVKALVRVLDTITEDQTTGARALQILSAAKKLQGVAAGGHSMFRASIFAGAVQDALIAANNTILNGDVDDDFENQGVAIITDLEQRATEIILSNIVDAPILEIAPLRVKAMYAVMTAVIATKKDIESLDSDGELGEDDDVAEAIEDQLYENLLTAQESAAQLLHKVFEAPTGEYPWPAKPQSVESIISKIFNTGPDGAIENEAKPDVVVSGEGTDSVVSIPLGEGGIISDEHRRKAVQALRDRFGDNVIGFEQALNSIVQRISEAQKRAS